MGNFNEMLHPSNKVGVTPLIVVKTLQFNEFLAYTRRIDAYV